MWCSSAASHAPHSCARIQKTWEWPWNTESWSSTTRVDFYCYLIFFVGLHYLDPLYPEAQSVAGAHGLPPLHVARFGDTSLVVLLRSRALFVHIHHLLVQVLPRFGSLSRSYKLLLQVCPLTKGEGKGLFLTHFNMCSDMYSFFSFNFIYTD